MCLCVQQQVKHSIKLHETGETAAPKPNQTRWSEATDGTPKFVASINNNNFRADGKLWHHEIFDNQIGVCLYAALLMMSCDDAITRWTQHKLHASNVCVARLTAKSK